MAASQKAVTFNDLKSQLAKRIYAPVYLLYGEEGYFIDELVKDFEAILPVEERDFNLYTMYALQTSADDVMDVCRRYPMMSEYQVVLLKEAQTQKADYFKRLSLYAQHPSQQTILVVCCRGEQVREMSSKVKDLVSEIKKCGGVVFESNRLNDRDMSSALSSLVNSKGLKIDQKALSMLREYIGSDLSHMYNEIDKLSLILGSGAMITPEAIERNIGVSKDFNNFELLNAVARKDAVKVFKIIDYFRANPKSNPTTLTASTLFNFFSNLLLLYFLKDRRDDVMLAELGLRSVYQLNDYKAAIGNYNAYKVIEIISEIRRFDAACKGIGSRQDERDLMHDLMYRILTAAGDISI